MKKILIVDDDVAVTNFLMVCLMQTGEYEPTVLNNSEVVPEVLKKENFDAIILDMDMPTFTGMDILKYVHKNKLPIATIVLTGVNDVDLAVESMKLGAFDYLTKPVEEEHLTDVLEKAIQQNKVTRTITQLPPNLSKDGLKAFKGFLACDKEVIRIVYMANKMAQGDGAIFISGERGTGKERLAKSIHNASPRANNEFISVDASTYNVQDFSIMLFGRDKNWGETKEEHCGFLEKADNGTLFIDSIDRLSTPTQLKLLRFIQQKEFYREGSTKLKNANVRIIVAADYDLSPSDTTVSNFDPNLLYHLMVNYLHLPPLRERKCDISLLVDKFLAREIKKRNLKIKGASKGYIQRLQKYFLPGNVHELRHIVASSIVFCKEKYLTPESLPPYVLASTRAISQREILLKIQTLQEVQEQHVKRMLCHFGDDLEICAKELGITLDELKKWQKKIQN